MPAINGYPIVFIFWNLFLAGIPCYIAYQFQKKLKKKTLKKISNKKQYLYLSFFIIWFFFLPNTAYLITLVRHLLDYCPQYNEYRVCKEQTWMVPFFFSYALLGVPSFWYALKNMAEALGRLIHKKIAFYLPIVMIPFSALAILLGLVERLNSWDIVAQPMLVLKTAGQYLYNPLQLLNLAVYTSTLYFIYYGVEWMKRLKVN